MNRDEEQVARIKRICKEVTYKPGTEWVVGSHLIRGGVTIHIRRSVPNVEDPTKETVIYTGQAHPTDILELYSDAEIVLRVLGGIIHYNEEHEIHEWFKYKGKCVVEPHPELTLGKAA